MNKQTGIREQIASAPTITDVRSLITVALGFKYASRKTIRRCKWAAKKRVSQLPERNDEQ